MFEKIKLIKFARKAVVGFLTPVIVAALAKYGLSIDSAELTTALAGVFTSLVVYLVPNAKAELESSDEDVEG